MTSAKTLLPNKVPFSHRDGPLGHVHLFWGDPIHPTTTAETMHWSGDLGEGGLTEGPQWVRETWLVIGGHGGGEGGAEHSRWSGARGSSLGRRALNVHGSSLWSRRMRALAQQAWGGPRTEFLTCSQGAWRLLVRNHTLRCEECSSLLPHMPAEASSEKGPQHLSPRSTAWHPRGSPGQSPQHWPCWAESLWRGVDGCLRSMLAA